MVVLAGLNKTKVNWKPSKALGSAGAGLLAVGSEGREKLSNWAEFVFGGQHCDEILVTLGRLFRAEILKLILGGLRQKHTFWVPADLSMCCMLEENHGKC